MSRLCLQTGTCVNHSIITFANSLEHLCTEHRLKGTTGRHMNPVPWQWWEISFRGCPEGEVRMTQPGKQSNQANPYRDSDLKARIKQWLQRVLQQNQCLISMIVTTENHSRKIHYRNWNRSYTAKIVSCQKWIARHDCNQQPTRTIFRSAQTNTFINTRRLICSQLSRYIDKSIEAPASIFYLIPAWQIEAVFAVDRRKNSFQDHSVNKTVQVFYKTFLRFFTGTNSI
jgi:uncharacterized CHY-type Zn-finger protein